MQRENTKSNIDFKSIFDSLPDLYLILDRDFNIIGVSDAYLQATMVGRKQILGKNIFDVFPDNPNDPKATGVKNLHASLQRVLKNKSADTMAIQKYDIQRPAERGGGFEERYWSPINNPVLGADQEVKYIVHRVEDVTEFIHLKKTGSEQLKLMEELRTKAGEMEVEIYRRAQEIQEANKLLEEANKNLARLDQIKTQFFANVSHELRTPLMLILGPLDVLLAEKSLPSSVRNTLRHIENNAQILLKHVNDLLNISKLDAGKMFLHYTNIDLAKLTRQTIALFEAQIPERQLAFSVDLPDELQAQMDPDKIQHILINILSNAIKFTPKNAKVWIRLEQINPETCRLQIEDNGPGIPPDLCETIFERFFQVEEPTTRTVGGTGLGLSIAKDFVELHGGAILAGNARNGGAIFTIELPLKAPQNVKVYSSYSQPLLGEKEISTSLAEFRNKVNPIKEAAEEDYYNRPLILVVEDNQEMNHFICKILNTIYRTESAFDGREGLQKSLALHPDLIVSDIMMPHMSGAEMVHAIRQHPLLLKTPIIILTAKADDELCVRMLEEGAQDYVIKPFSVKEFKARVANLILVKKAEDEMDQFVYHASHDLKAPLPAMEHLISWIEEDLGEMLSEQSKKYLLLLRQRASRMSKLLDGLLKYAQSGYVFDKVRKIHTDRLITDIIRKLNPPQTITFQLEDTLPVLNTCELPLREVFTALLDNSIRHHHRKDGHIIIGTKEKDRFYEFFVADDGPGIEKKYQDRIFQLFQTLQPRDKLETSGVGLSIAKKIVEFQGGKISVESEKNKGCVFRFLWPKDKEIGDA
ncbi:TPA: response regulator [Legionella pneumophila]|uniref:histidine kinase n=1 Tax=Legionella pneumophila TaxID=446 RepID=A0AAN5KSB9_LEGPN|nr:response regulator [Legionella pneumophila]HAT1973129.1 response regulator [Legionella pneumophila]HAT6958170.1 response regulator [Legionella pneumophila]HBC0465794.1 response regulator [Legionella pneumophila]HEN4771132.1 response regulator [Legionella pneumophila]